MKVIQINIVNKYKSTGRTCYEVLKYLQNHGHECFIAYGKGVHNDSDSYRIGDDISYYTHNIMSRITGIQGYNSKQATYRLIDYIDKTAPSIIHLRNLHAYYLNLPMLFNYLHKLNIPIIQNLHDCWPFTGKCTHYTDIGCNKWQFKCGNCPKLKEYPQSLFFDRVEKMYLDKQQWYQQIRHLYTIGVSEWISSEAQKSFLSTSKISTIYNWIDTNQFQPIYNEKKGSSFTIAFMATRWEKNSSKYVDLIKLIKMLGDRYRYIVIGESSNIDLPSTIERKGFTNNIRDLAIYLSEADVYVHLSTEDSFGKTVIEAQACGVPTIVYNSTALPELISSDCGYIVNKHDLEAVIDAIQRIEARGKYSFSSRCRDAAILRFSSEKKLEQLLQYYQQIIGEVSSNAQ